MKLSLFTLLFTTAMVSGFAPVTITKPKTSLDVSITPWDNMGVPDIMTTPNPKRKVAIPPRAKESKGGLGGNVMIDPDFTMPRNLAAIAPGLVMMYPSIIGLSSAAFHLVLAAFLWSQTNRVRVVFGKDSFEIFNMSNDGTYLKEKPSNYVAGTVNRWRYDSIVEYGFFPHVDYPFIVYFKDSATPNHHAGNYGWWGRFIASNFDPTKTKKEGQPHFMPGLFDVKEFVKQMEKRGLKPRPTYFRYSKEE